MKKRIESFEFLTDAFVGTKYTVENANVFLQDMKTMQYMLYTLVMDLCNVFEYESCYKCAKEKYGIQVDNLIFTIEEIYCSISINIKYHEQVVNGEQIAFPFERLRSVRINLYKIAPKSMDYNTDGVNVAYGTDRMQSMYHNTRLLYIFTLLLYMLLRSYLYDIICTIRDLIYELLYYISPDANHHKQVKVELGKIITNLQLDPLKDDEPVNKDDHGTIFGPIIINYFDEIRKKVFPLPFLGSSIQPTKFNPLKDSIEITNPFVRSGIIFEHTASSEPMITWFKKKGNTETFLHTY